jgi:hypothetical protein
MYRIALAEVSTSPLYVLVTVHDVKTGQDREVCIPGTFLLGAIHMERHLRYDARGSAEALNIALSQANRTFSFSRPDALRNVRPRYMPALLAEVRKKYAEASVGELLGAQNYDGGMRDAIAHVLLERGTLVGIADMGGNLFIYEPPKSEWPRRYSPDLATSDGL